MSVDDSVRAELGWFAFMVGRYKCSGWEEWAEFMVVEFERVQDGRTFHVP